jgi:3-phenylpropionate/trans-cinnamate dioxygenase ferredoxin component
VADAETWHPVADDRDAPDGTLIEVFVDGDAVLLARVDGRWAAVAGDCTHDECPLVDGEVIDGAVHCMCHGAAFDLTSGEVVEPPATEALAVHVVRSRDGRLEVSLHRAN